MATYFWLVKEDGEVRAITFDGWEAGRAYVKNEDGTNTWYEVFLTNDNEVVIKEDDAEGTTFYKYNSEVEAAGAGWRHILESERVRWGLNELREWRERNERMRNEWLQQIEEYKKANS
jgi:hypothetical protein